jgi:NAD(P)-dependent dehydrogenase (short-subunit alcohol dehydrogenase family)
MTRFGDNFFRTNPMEKMLAGKKLVIIGGTTGIGLRAALDFCAWGAQLVIIGHDPETSGHAAGDLPAEVLVLTADARETAAAEHAIQACQTRFGGFDGLLHVAGGSGRRFGDGPLHQMTQDAWEQTLTLNLTTFMWSNRAAIRQFLSDGGGGAIVNISSALAYAPAPQHFQTHAYAAAKAAIIGLSTSLAAAYASGNIRVNTVAPGLVDTPMARRALSDEHIMAYVRQRQPLDRGRAVLPQDISGIAGLLLSDAGAFITGQTIGVDGGWGVAG